MAARAGEVAGSRAAGFPVKSRAVWQPGSEAYDLASGSQAAGRNVDSLMSGSRSEAVS